MSVSICMSVSVCLSMRISLELHARSLPNLCMLPMSVAQSSSGMLTIGHIAFRREAGDGSAQRGQSVIYDCLVVYCRWFTHFYVVGSFVNSFMFLLILFSYATSSALPFVIEVSVDLLCIGLKQHVVNTGEIFSSYKLYVACEVCDVVSFDQPGGILATKHSTSFNHNNDNKWSIILTRGCIA